MINSCVFMDIRVAPQANTPAYNKLSRIIRFSGTISIPASFSILNRF